MAERVYHDGIGLSIQRAREGGLRNDFYTAYEPGHTVVFIEVPTGTGVVSIGYYRLDELLTYVQPHLPRWKANQFRHQIARVKGASLGVEEGVSYVPREQAFMRLRSLDALF